MTDTYSYLSTLDYAYNHSKISTSFAMIKIEHSTLIHTNFIDYRSSSSVLHVLFWSS